MRAWLLLIAACSHAPVCKLPPARPNGPPHLWMATKPGSPGTIYLFGTIHTVGGDDIAPEVTKLVDGASHYASELGDNEPDHAKLVALQRIPEGGETLDHILPTHEWFELDTAMRGAMSTEDLRHARPWYAMVALMNHVAPTPRPSMDVALTARAKDHRVPIAALEDWGAQMIALDKAVTAVELGETIRDRDSFACSYERLRAAYLAADIPQLEATLRVENNPLLRDRNHAWLPLVEKYAAMPGTTVIAVGLGHLLGPDSVPAMLAADGFSITQQVR